MTPEQETAFQDHITTAWANLTEKERAEMKTTPAPIVIQHPTPGLSWLVDELMCYGATAEEAAAQAPAILDALP